MTLPHRTSVVFGSAFVDIRGPHNGLGNPFAVVMGADVGAWDVGRWPVTSVPPKPCSSTPSANSAGQTAPTGTSSTSLT
ncbi:hypothetical protein [Nonomuraea sp. NPDC049400]|uniref:hypothetical protein n=1 Tax=Nonomuraea sp. NPDC049400 TaxID=3364352 RepID=UPI0037B22470